VWKLGGDGSCATSRDRMVSDAPLKHSILQGAPDGEKLEPVLFLFDSTQRIKGLQGDAQRSVIVEYRLASLGRSFARAHGRVSTGCQSRDGRPQKRHELAHCPWGNGANLGGAAPSGWKPGEVMVAEGCGELSAVLWITKPHRLYGGTGSRQRMSRDATRRGRPTAHRLEARGGLGAALSACRCLVL